MIRNFANPDIPLDLEELRFLEDDLAAEVLEEAAGLEDAALALRFSSRISV